MAVVAIVFLVGAMTVSSFTSLLIWLPIGGALVIWLLPLSRYATGALAVLVALAEVGIWIEQAARFDFSRSGLQFSQKHAVDQGPARLVPRRRVRILALARRADGRRDGRVRSATASGSAATGRAPTSG